MQCTERGFMKGWISIDTLYLNVKYPKMDIFQTWYRYAEKAAYRKLKQGIPVGDFVVRNGTQGYKVSVWQHDARIFLTDQVDDKLGDGNGMGIWVQLGPKFLIHHANNLQHAVRELLSGIGINSDYPISITRLDIALDIPDVSMQDQDINSWRYGWVGRSKMSANFFNSRTGALETINIGSRASAVFLRIYDKLAQAIKEGDIEYWWDAWKCFPKQVTRIEWEIKPTGGGFTMLKDFYTFNGFPVIELLNYLLKWGRLCIPNPDDSNNRRWKEDPFWKNVRTIVNEWSDGVDWLTSRKGKEFHGVSEKYVKQVSGTFSGAMARLGKDSPDMISMFDEMARYGESLDVINKKAVEKAAVYSKL